MFNLFKEIHNHSVDVEEQLANLPKEVSNPKAVELTFGIMGSVLVAGGFVVAAAGVTSEVHRVSDLVAKHEAKVIDVAKMGLVDPLLIAGGGLLCFTGLEDIAIANGLRRRRGVSENDGSK